VKEIILIVEDDAHLADGLLINLELEGYAPVWSKNAEEAWHMWQRGGVRLVLLDIMLPGMDGFDFCRRLRRAGERVPVIFLTARDRDEDRIRGLELGGDDYLVKPFNLRELLARIKGIFRREEWQRSRPIADEIAIGENKVNLLTYRGEGPSGSFELGEKEAMILRLLAEKSGEPVDRDTIIDRVWGYDAYPSTRTVDNFVLRLRKLLEPDPAHPRYLLTVHRKGYRLELEKKEGA